MGRAGLRKGLWTPEEDKILIKHIEKHGCGMWTTLAKQAGLLRCGKSCRLRWKNYLNPDIKRGPFTFEEEKLVFQLQAHLGNRWSTIATHLPGRTDNDIKNLWSRRLKKRSLLDLDPTTTQDSILPLGLANQAPASPTTGVMSQWESATLEPEARLPGDPMPFTTCDNLFDIWNSEVVESFTTTLAPWDDESTSWQIPFSRTASSSSALVKSSTNSCGSKEVAMASCSSPCTKDDDDSSDSALQLLLDSPLIGGDDDMTFLEEKSDAKMSQSPAVGF